MTEPLFTYGWNKPGYLPDFVSEEAMPWDDARAALLWEVERWDEGEMTSEQLDAAEVELKTAAEGAEIEVHCGPYALFVLKTEA